MQSLKLFLTVLFVLSYLFTFSQPSKKKTSSTTSVASPHDMTTDNLYEHYKVVYEQATKYSDLIVAREALYHMLALKPQQIGLKDTLTYLYYQSNNHVQVILLGREILQDKPNKSDILELVAVSQQNLGLLKEALESFEKLFGITKDTYHQYSIASLQYMLKRYGECSENLNSIIASADTIGEVTITDNNGISQKVPLKAAAFNMRGVIALEISQPDVAKQNFQKAIELYPEFALAKSNLAKVTPDIKTAPEKKK